MADAAQRFERRLTKLEADVLAIKRRLSLDNNEPWWRQTAGMFKGDKVFAKIIRLGRQIREAERKSMR
jgi:hypothetical protein